MSTLRRARPPRSIHRLATALALLLGSPGINAAVEIEHWQYFFKARVTAMDTLIEYFEKANPDNTVTTNQLPYADYRTKVAAAIPAGEGPEVVQPFYGWLNDYVDAGLITPLPVDRFDPAAIEAEFFPMVQAMKRDGQYMALPTAVRSMALFYNQRLFDDTGIDGPPAALAELVEIAEKLTVRDNAGNLMQIGITSKAQGEKRHAAVKYTLPAGLTTFNVEQAVEWELIMTGAAISSLPTLIVFLIFQRFIIRGVVMAGLKG